MLQHASHVIHPIHQQDTKTVKFGNADWACPNNAVTPHTLHCLVLDLVGEKLTDFENSPVHDALLAHQDAYQTTQILHQDLTKLVIIEGPQQMTHTGTWQFISAYLVKNTCTIHSIKDDLESSLYIVLWTALIYRESHMTVVNWMQFIVQIFNADPLVGSGGCAKLNWLVARTDFPQDIFVDYKLLDNFVLELVQFFLHWASVITPKAQEKLVQLQLSLQELLDEVGPVCMAVQQKMIDVAESCLLESAMYQKEMGMEILHSHEAVINIYNKPSGKKCRLDPVDDNETLSSVAGLDNLVSFGHQWYLSKTLHVMYLSYTYDM
ncbi:uncharacterized protein BJ212DRAFT_1477017 [Suillus subaureus]|uniref:Fungal-type protein kinase domain-containing protein n=1 Tax=Suillus subaureus TaxID=48587 RepID=A0A9P7JH94_9AGAM|nr:uncharacterized protein BJ212DRAFT_1477017 [Suillus subaureus]KAG1822597.1 hypothetical protein BJ212DRAFT_1477017 [Suillus subaureus]